MTHNIDKNQTRANFSSRIVCTIQSNWQIVQQSLKNVKCSRENLEGEYYYALTWIFPNPRDTKQAETARITIKNSVLPTESLLLNPWKKVSVHTMSLVKKIHPWHIFESFHCWQKSRHYQWMSLQKIDLYEKGCLTKPLIWF